MRWILLIKRNEIFSDKRFFNKNFWNFPKINFAFEICTILIVNYHKAYTRKNNINLILIENLLSYTHVYSPRIGRINFSHHNETETPTNR